MTLRPDENHARVVQSPLASQIEELTLMEDDLSRVVIALQVLSDKYFPPDDVEAETEVIGLALWRDSVVQFASCFDLGRPHALDAAEALVGHEQGVAFVDWVYDLRDSYAAHSWGAPRQAVACALIDPQSGKIGWISPTTFHAPQWSAEAIEMLRLAASETLNHVRNLRRKVANDLIAEINNLSADEIYSLPRPNFFAPHSNEVVLSPKSLRRSRSHPQDQPASRRKPLSQRKPRKTKGSKP